MENVGLIRRRLPHRGNGHVPAPVQNVEAKVEEPKAPPVQEEVKPAHDSVTDCPPAVQAAVPTTSAGHSAHQLQAQNTPAQAVLPASPSTTCTHHQLQQPTPLTQCSPSILPTPQIPHHSHPLSPLSTRPPAICRRWLIGTCRRGPSCRNRHTVLSETDAELERIRDAHLATIRFYARAREEAKEEELRKLGGGDGDMGPGGGGGGGFVEAFVEGLGRVNIPVEALGGQLRGLKLGAKQRSDVDMEVGVDAKAEELVAAGTGGGASPAVSATESHLEPLPDYTLSMPPTTPTTPSAPFPAPGTRANIQRLPRAQPLIHPAERFRASYAPQHLPLPRTVQPSAYSRRQPQDFVPRYVLDRALQQYIASSLRGRRFLAGPRPGGARKRMAMVAQKSLEVEGKGGFTAVPLTVPAGKEEGAEVGEKRKELWSDACNEGQAVETPADKPTEGSALLVDIAPV